MGSDERRTPGQGRGQRGRRGQSVDAPQGPSRAAGSLERGCPRAGVRRRARQNPAIPDVGGRRSSRLLERDSGKRRRRGGIARCPPHPPLPRDPHRPCRPALPWQCGLAAALGVPASGLPALAGLRRRPSAPRLGARDPNAGPAVGPFGRDRRRRAKARRGGVVVARSLRSRGAPDESRGLRPERWSKSPALVRAPGCFRIARGRGHQFTHVYTLGTE